jgi:hypothetical protein
MSRKGPSIDRIVEALEAEYTEPLRWFYCSFAGEHFNGAVIIQAHGVADCSLRAHRKKINPGGELAAWEVTQERLPPEKYRNRLLTKAEILELWPDAKSIREHEESRRGA